MPPMSTAGPRTGQTGKLRVAIAWIGTALILGYLVMTTDLRHAWEAFIEADQFLFLGTMLWSVPLVWVADSASVVLVLRRAGFRIGLREFLRIKGASYLLNILNYNLALAMMAALVSRRSERGLAASGSPFILLNFLDLGALGLLILAGLAAGARPFEDPGVLWTLGLFAAAGVVSGPFLCGLAQRVRPRDPAEPRAVLARVFRRAIAHDLLLAFRRFSLAAYLRYLLLRMAFVSLYVFSNFFLLRSFSIEVPLGDLFVYQPILAFIIFIPISVAGLGSTQVVMRVFYEPFVAQGLLPTAVVDAYSTSTIVMFVLMRSVIGLVSMPWVSRALREERDPSPPPQNSEVG